MPQLHMAPYLSVITVIHAAHSFCCHACSFGRLQHGSFHRSQRLVCTLSADVAGLDQPQPGSPVQLPSAFWHRLKQQGELPEADIEVNWRQHKCLFSILAWEHHLLKLNMIPAISLGTTERALGRQVCTNGQPSAYPATAKWLTRYT